MCVSLQVFFGLPLGLVPSTSYSIHFFIQSLSSFCNTCPYHRNLFRCSTKIMSSKPSLLSTLYSELYLVTSHYTSILPFSSGITGARDSEWQWHQLDRLQICTLLQADNHTNTPPLSFLQAGCHSCCPTNSIKAPKALSPTKIINSKHESTF